ncbi:DUF4363 family protein [Phosphitispora fastidiosa]|uniref:DUF4363 family protein n=1 Tax=Phosphitispora fastidiosa TaxID=2837202 RepID=UPI001E567719|nr:DUF4363 family protein [Phosphitispora fastidiosa]MBU7008086.1 hypothetical protein [Phosphitispora fastidiosa]
MKIVVATIVILALLLGFGTYAYYYLDSTANELLVMAERIEKSVANDDWQQAESDFSKLHAIWERTIVKWTILIDHIELDQINTSMSRTKKFMDTRDLSGFMSEMAELKLLIKHVPEKEALNMKNVL